MRPFEVASEVAMSFSLETLWKDATDDAIRDAVTKWNSINDQGRAVILAEAKRRGLTLDVPKAGDPTTNASSAGAAPAVSAKVWIFVAIGIAAVAAIAMLT
jgi:hypothetical protein